MTSSDPWGVKQAPIDWSEQVEEELKRGPLPQDETAKTKGRKKKAAQKISLGEFMTADKGQTPTHGRPLTDNELLMMLPKAPKEKDPNAPQRSWNQRSSYQRGGYDRERRRDREEDYGGSRADEHDHWGNNRGSRYDRTPSRGSSRGHEESYRNLDGDWTRENRFQPSSRQEDRSRRSYGFHGRQDDRWGGSREATTQARRPLQLDKRTKPLAEGAEAVQTKPKNNPFGSARPREDVLKERGGSDVFSSRSDVASDQDYHSRSGSPGGSHRSLTVERVDPFRPKKREDPFGGARPREENLNERGDSSIGKREHAPHEAVPRVEAV